MKPLVLIGLLGPTLDQGKGPARWERWRPTVAVCQHEDLLISRFELLHQHRFAALAEKLKQDISSVSPETDVQLKNIEFQDAWDFEQVYSALHDFALRYPFKQDKEDYLIHITTGTHVAQICMFLLTEAHYFPGKLLQASPPKRGGKSHAGSYSIIDLDLSIYDKLASRFHQEQLEGLSFLKSGIETKNAAFNSMVEQIEYVAIKSRSPILLTGPTGAGKSQLAKRVYQLKKLRHRLEGPFVEVNCATLKGDAAMSTLFGHKKGAFTGAMQDRPGLLLAANGGILFLDELGELGLDEQAMLLRALEEKRFLPVGSDKEVNSKFQLIAGTNRDLDKEVNIGRFREDLLARINLWTYELPGLRHRLEDIEPNVEYELNKFAADNRIQVNFNKEARQSYLKFATSSKSIWKRNFRDLNASITRLCTLAPGARITSQLVDEEIQRLQKAWKSSKAGDNHMTAILTQVISEKNIEDMDLFSQLQLASVIKICRESNTLADAGRRLFAASRQRKSKTNDSDRLRKYLQKFGLSWQMLN